MESEDKIRKIFLLGAGILLVLIVGGLVWAIMSDSGNGGNIDPNLAFNDERNPSIGPADAKVTVRIYSDMQCPACKVAEAELSKVRDQYQDRVRFIWNDLPLTQIHPNAAQAAVSARCAGEQGRFWEYMDKIFETQESWEYLTNPMNHFVALVNEMNLNEDRFNQCVLSGEKLELIQADYEEAVSLGLSGTPTFFINRKKIVGAVDQETWIQELDTALAN